jgi:hypothetical protein
VYVSNKMKYVVHSSTTVCAYYTIVRVKFGVHVNKASQQMIGESKLNRGANCQNICCHAGNAADPTAPS